MLENTSRKPIRGLVTLLSKFGAIGLRWAGAVGVALKTLKAFKTFKTLKPLNFQKELKLFKILAALTVLKALGLFKSLKRF